MSLYTDADSKLTLDLFRDRQRGEITRVRFEVEVDTNALVKQLGERAFTNKSKVAKLCRGAVKVIVHSHAPVYSR